MTFIAGEFKKNLDSCQKEAACKELSVSSVKIEEGMNCSQDESQVVINGTVVCESKTNQGRIKYTEFHSQRLYKFE